MVGQAVASDGSPHAFFWTPTGGMVDLGTLNDISSGALLVSDTGQIVGGTYYGPFSWTPAGGMVNIGTLGGTTYPTGVNNSGQVVGWFHR